MITLRHLEPATDVAWAVPTSGYGHVADEQTLPYIHHEGQPLTPLYGGEESQPACMPTTAGLPYGTLATPWPWRQRRFNLARRPVNLYWRNLFTSRCSSDRQFLLLHQLDFAPLRDGFAGTCPLLRFERHFVLSEGAIEVRDSIAFKVALHFERFTVSCIPLFPEWQVNGDALPRLDIAEPHHLVPTRGQQSAAGEARIWTDEVTDVHFHCGQTLNRTYTYRWGPQS